MKPGLEGKGVKVFCGKLFYKRYEYEDIFAATRLDPEIIYISVADPGFPRVGGANPPGGGASTYDFVQFSQKLHEIERIWMGGESWSKILLCRSATACFHFFPPGRGI